jgi:hypothetical protein
MTRAGGNGQLYIGKEKDKLKTTGDYRISRTGNTERTAVVRSGGGDPDHDAGIEGGGGAYSPDPDRELSQSDPLTGATHLRRSDPVQHGSDPPTLVRGK